MVTPVRYPLEGQLIMALLESVGYPLVGLIGIFIGLSLANYFGTQEGYLVGVSLGALDILMIGTS